MIFVSYHFVAPQLSCVVTLDRIENNPLEPSLERAMALLTQPAGLKIQKYQSGVLFLEVGRGVMDVALKSDLVSRVIF